MPLSLSRIFLAVSPGVAAAHVGWYYSVLPDRMASHFGPGGAADWWMSRPAFAATYVGFIAGMALLYIGLVWGLPRFPVSMINLPRRGHWLAPERREQTLKDLGRQLTGMGCATVLLLIVVFHLCIRANLDNTFRLDPTVFVIPVSLFVVALVLCLGRLVWRYARPASYSAG